MVYIVSGFLRSGTSMMMVALREGGLPIVGERDPEGFNVRYARPASNYLPNPGGFWLFTGNHAAANFPQLYANRAVKLAWDLVPHIPRSRDGYRVVFLRRDPVEIAQSLRAFLGADADLEDFALAGYEGRILADYAVQMNRAVNLLQARGDCTVSELNYADVVAQPVTAFTSLQAAGWPIDPAACAAVVDSDLYRSRGL